MKIRKFAAALLALVLCLSLSLPAAFAATEQRVELKNLTVNVKLDLCQYFGQKKLKYYADFFSSSSSLCCGVI